MNLNLRQITSKLSTRGWLTVGAAALVGVIFIYILLSMASAPSYTTILAGTTPSQAQKVTTALSAAGIPYQLDNNGTAIGVQSSDVGQARDTLDTQGLLSGASSTSLETLLGNQSLGESNFQQEEQSTSALEQQLEQNIETMNGINSAEVELAIPDQTDNLFSGVNTQPSASVLINTNSTLGSTAVKAIAQSVSGAVPGLSINRVTITDQDGDLLWPGSGTSGTSALTARQSSEQAYDTQTAEEADAYLDATIGPNKALVQLDADLNTNTQTVSSVTYGKTKIPLTQTTGNEKLNGNPDAATAAGNTATKIAAVAGTSTTGNTNYTNDTNTVSNGVNKTVSQTSVAPGSIIRQGISVLVNSTVPASEIPAIKAAVENSVGYVKSRGDTIAVNAVTFAKVPSIAKSSSKPLGDVKYVLVGLASLLFLLFIARLLRKRENDNFAGNPTWLRELEYPRSLAEIESTQMVDLEGPAMVARLRPPVNVARQQVEDLVDRDPERVAAQIRQWMTED